MYSSKEYVKKKRSLLDPRTKIFLNIMVLIFVFSTILDNRSSYIRLIISFLPYFLLLTERKFKLFFKGSLIQISGYLFLYLSMIIKIKVICLAFNFSALLIIKLAPMMVMGMYLTSSISISEFNSCAEKLRISQNITIPLSIIVRFLPTLFSNLKIINENSKIKNISILKKGLYKTFEYKIAAFVNSSVKIGDELALASITRGLTNENKRTNICNIGIRFIDVLIYIVFIGLIIYLKVY